MKIHGMIAKKKSATTQRTGDRQSNLCCCFLGHPDASNGARTYLPQSNIDTGVESTSQAPPSIVRSHR